MNSDTLHDLFAYIPVLERGELKDAHATYITTGDYQPQVRDLQNCLQRSGLCSREMDWMAWIDEARPFLQTPEKILTADSATIDKLLAIATYSEKLNKSFFPHLCSSGFMLMLLKRLQNLG